MVVGLVFGVFQVGLLFPFYRLVAGKACVATGRVAAASFARFCCGLVCAWGHARSVVGRSRLTWFWCRDVLPLGMQSTRASAQAFPARSVALAFFAQWHWGVVPFQGASWGA